MDLSIVEIDSPTVEMDLSIGEIDPITVEMDVSSDEPFLSITEMDIKIELHFESLLSCIEHCEKLFNENKSCQNYNIVLNLLKNSIKKSGIFKETMYSFQCFSINNFCKIPYVILLIKNIGHRQATCMTVIECIEVVPEFEAELLLIKQFMEDNIEYI